LGRRAYSQVHHEEGGLNGIATKGSTRFTFQARTETGRLQLPTGTTNRVLAQKIAAMWEELAEQHRAWDILNRVPATPKITRLWDLYVATDGSVPAIRRLLEDVNLERYVSEWQKVYQKQRPKNLQKTLTRLRILLPEGEALPRPIVTRAWLTEKLYGYIGEPRTLQGVHSAWSVFFGYLMDVHGLFESNPMDRVARPPAKHPRVAFFELDAVERIVAAQMTPELQAFYAIAYGTGIETGVSLNLTRADIWESSQEIRAAGTRAPTRDRVAKVSPWAWPFIWGYAQHQCGRLFPVFWRDDTMSRWHSETLKGLELPHLALHNARHHCAVTHLRAGVPLELVRRQLGHSSPVLTLKTYGAFIPSGEDRARWEGVVAADQARRREAK
jgi:integrase